MNYLEAVLRVEIDGDLVAVDAISGIELPEIEKWVKESTTETSRKYGFTSAKFRRVYVVNNKKSYSDWHEINLKELK